MAKKVTQTERHEIYTRYVKGESPEDVARDYQITERRCWQICAELEESYHAAKGDLKPTRRAVEAYRRRIARLNQLWGELVRNGIVETATGKKPARLETRQPTKPGQGRYPVMRLP